MSGGEALILSSGMVTAVGLGTDQTVTSVRAGLAGFRDTALIGRHYEPIAMATLPESALPPIGAELECHNATARYRRLLRLGAAALAELASKAPDLARIPMVVAAPESHPEVPFSVGPEFVKHVAMLAGVPVDVNGSECFEIGRAGLAALDRAIRLIAQGESQEVIVGGVDSFRDLRLLSTLEAEGRVAGSQALDGFIPGEGACFLLVSSERALAGREPIASVSGVAFAEEPGDLYAEAPHRGESLAAAIQSLVATTGVGPWRSVYAGLNGESFWGKEWGVAVLRNHPDFVEELRIEHPADCLGDTGAAMAPLMLGIAGHELQEGHLEGPCLLWCASDGPSRAAVSIDAVG